MSRSGQQFPAPLPESVTMFTISLQVVVILESTVSVIFGTGNGGFACPAPGSALGSKKT